MTEQRDPSRSSFLRAVGRILRFLVRLLFVLVIGTLIGLGLFYGVPWAYRQFVWPIYDNSSRITILEAQVAKNSESIFDNHRALEQRVVNLETEIADLREQVSVQAQDQETLEEDGQELAQRVAALENDLETRLDAQEQDIEQVRSDVVEAASDLEDKIVGIQAQLEEAQQELDQQVEMSQGALGDLEGQLGGLEGQLVDLEGQLDGAVARLALLQTAQGLVKIRLLLVEENPGAARDTLDLVIAQLDRARQLDASQAETLDDVRERMVALDGLIADRSFRARPNLEALWADVMDLVMPLTAQSTVTATQMTSPLPTPTPSP